MKSRHHLVEARPHVCGPLFVLRIVHHVAHFIGVALQIVHLVEVEPVEHVLEAVGNGDALRIQELAAVEGAQDVVAPRCAPRVGEQGLQGGAVGKRQRPRPRCGDIRVRQVVGLHQARGFRSGLGLPRPAHNQRHAIALLIGKPALDPHSVRAHHVAMVHGEHHQRAVGLPRVVERLQHPADLRVHLLRVRVVVGAALAHVVFGHRTPGLRLAAVQTGLARERVGEALRHGNGARIVAVQVLFQRQVGIVRFRELDLQMPRLRTFGEARHHARRQFRVAPLRSGLLGALSVAPHGEGLRSRPAHHALVGHLDPLGGERHAIRVQIQVLQKRGIAAADPSQFLKAEIEWRTQVAGVPLADVAQTIARLAQALGVEHHVGVHVAMHGGRRMHLVVHAVVPVIGAAQEHGARRTAHRRGRVTALEEQPLARQPVDVGRAADRASGDSRPLLLIGHDVQNVGPLARVGRLRRGGRHPRRTGEKAPAVQSMFRHASSPPVGQASWPVRFETGQEAYPTIII